MLSTSTIEILKKLNPQELKRLGDFINSPYHNKTSGLKKIYEIIEKAHPDYASEDLKPENMSKKIFGAGAYKEKRLRNLCSDFGNLLRKFIGYEMIAVDPQGVDIYISHGLTLKHLFSMSNKLISKSLKEYGSDTLSHEERFRYSYWLEAMYLQNLAALREHASAEFTESFKNVTEKLVIHFYTQILKSSLNDDNLRKVLKTKETELLGVVRNATDMQKIFDYFERLNSEYSSFLKIHYLFYVCFTSDEIKEEQYTELKAEILKIIRRLSKIDQELTTNKILYLIQHKFAQLNEKYLEDVSEFIELFRELKIYPDELIPAYSDTSFRDVFKTAIQLEKYEWAEKFAEEFIGYLAEDFRESFSCYCKVVLSFCNGKYEESLKNLSDVKLLGITEKIDSRFYQIMNYIELKAYESAFSALTSYKQFLNDSKEMPDVYRDKVETALKYFNEIIKCAEQGKKIDGMIFREAKNGDSYMQKEYVLKKMEELE